MAEKEKRKKTSGSVKINPETLQDARIICEEKMLKLSAYVSRALYRENSRQKRMK